MIVRRYVRVGSLLRWAWKPLLAMSLYSALVVGVHEAGYAALALPIGVATMLGTSLSILLGFRTSSAYDRWWEARKIWGGIVNDSRSLARQVLTLYTSQEFERAELRELQRRMIRRQIGWGYALKRSLRDQAPEADLEGLIDGDEREALRGQKNVHAALLQTQSEDARTARERGWVEPILAQCIEQLLVRFSDHMGKCERIKKTHFSTPYTYILSRALLLFFLLLPAGLVQHLGWLAVPVSVAVAGFFALINTIGDYLQDPFENHSTDTPMDAICRTIEINLRQQLGESDLPPAIEPVDGVLM